MKLAEVVAGLRREGISVARIRAGRWTDPSAGKITVSDWIERWLAMQDVGIISTADNRVPDPAVQPARMERQPAERTQHRGDHQTGERPTRQGRDLPAPARTVRTLLSTMLGDAAAAKPPLIRYNPALRPRNRGRADLTSV